MKTRIASSILIAAFFSSTAFAEGWRGVDGSLDRDKQREDSAPPQVQPEKRGFLVRLIFGQLEARYGIVPADDTQAELLASRLNLKTTAQLEMDLQGLENGAILVIGTESADAAGTAPSTYWPVDGVLGARKGTTGSPTKITSEDIGQVTL